LIAVAISLCLAVPALAISATGPYTIKTLNANVCVGFSPDEPNTAVTQQDASGTHCRNMFFDQAGHVNGNPYGEWETSSGLALASPNCTPSGGSVLVEPAHSTGTTWVNFLTTGGFYIVNRRCDGLLGHNDCLMVLGASGSTGQQWFVTNIRTVPGRFYRIHLIRHSAGQQPAHKIRAGC